MNFVDIIAMLAVLQYLIFGGLVGQARGKYGVKAPAVVGDANFERIYRVQMNTLELLVALIPSLYVAARYWPGQYVAAVGAVYLVGRIIYWRAYVNGTSRGLGFNMSMFPIFILVLAALVPAAVGRSAA